MVSLARSVLRAPKGPSVSQTPLAESEGFEPPIRLLALLLPKQPVSATHPTLKLLCSHHLASPSKMLMAVMFFRQRKNRPARYLKFGLVRLAVRETLTSRTLDRKRRTFPVLYAESGAMIVTEVVFRQITMKVFFIAMLIDARHATFEN